MDYKIKGIETEYKGIWMRSRTEARWAAFFDGLRLNWVYEPESFDTGDDWYLPDFYIKELDRYIEVKPTRGYPNPIWDLADKVKAANATNTSGGKDIMQIANKLIMVCGQPKTRLSVGRPIQAKSFAYVAVDYSGNEMVFYQDLDGRILVGNTNRQVTNRLWNAFREVEKLRFPTTIVKS